MEVAAQEIARTGPGTRVRSHLELECAGWARGRLVTRRGSDAARRAFGNAALVKEITREIWGWTSIERFRQDVRYAFGGMRRNPAVSAVAVLSLALGIGANTAIFSLIDAVILEKLPVKNTERLVLLGDGTSSASNDDEPFGNWGLFSYPIYREFQSRNQVFSGPPGVLELLRPHVSRD